MGRQGGEVVEEVGRWGWRGEREREKNREVVSKGKLNEGVVSQDAKE
jgi:hypothetical protein